MLIDSIFKLDDKETQRRSRNLGNPDWICSGRSSLNNKCPKCTCWNRPNIVCHGNDQKEGIGKNMDVKIAASFYCNTNSFFLQGMDW